MLEATAIVWDREESASHEAMRTRLAKMNKQAQERAPERELKVTLVHRMRHNESLSRQNWIRGRLRWFDKDDAIHRMHQRSSIQEKVTTTVARSWNSNCDWAYEFDFKIYKSQIGDPEQNEEYVSLWKNSVPELKKPSAINEAGAVYGDLLRLPSGKDSPKLIECKKPVDVVNAAEQWLTKYELAVNDANLKNPNSAENPEGKMLPAVVNCTAAEPRVVHGKYNEQSTAEQFINYARESLRKRAAFPRPSSQVPAELTYEQSFQVMHR